MTISQPRTSTRQQFRLNEAEIKAIYHALWNSVEWEVSLIDANSNVPDFDKAKSRAHILAARRLMKRIEKRAKR